MKTFSILFLSIVSIIQIGFLALFASVPADYEWKTIDTISLVVTLLAIAIQWTLFYLAAKYSNTGLYFLSFMPAVSVLVLVLLAQ